MSQRPYTNFNILKISKKRGFTLVEMIVALGVFSIVATVALGALMKIISANRKAQTLQTSITNLNFALESMSREFRDSKYFQCGDSLTSLGDCDDWSVESESVSKIISFDTNKTGADASGSPCNIKHAYLFKPVSDLPSDSDLLWTLERATQKPDCTSITDTDFASILDPNVNIDGYSLQYIKSSDDSFPLISVKISGFSGKKETDKTYFNIQTAVSPRTI
jgi:prepilin-type N-terminal cleavage/methylation domain-containing protein